MSTPAPQPPSRLPRSSHRPPDGGQAGAVAPACFFLSAAKQATSPAATVPTHWCIDEGYGLFGGTYQQIFYVADVEASGPPLDGDLHVDLDEADFLAVFPLAGAGRARLIGIVRDERAEHPGRRNSKMSAAGRSVILKCGSAR